MGKFKGAIVGDQHFCDRSPQSRTDDYTQAILGKMRWILTYCREKGIPHVFLLGDMFHFKQPTHTSHWLVQTVIGLFKEFQPDVQAWTLVGNHDFTTNLKGLPRQPITTVLQSGAVHPMGLTGYPELFECGDFNVEVNGAPYRDGAPEDGSGGTEGDPTAYKLMYVDDKSFKVALYHATLLPDGDRFFGRYVNFGQAAPYIGAHFVGCGHYHPGYEPVVIEAHGKTWTNPGSISRGSAEDHNLIRPIRFVTFLYDGTLRTKVVEVPHRPGPAVFDVEALERRKEEDRQHSEFVEKLTADVAGSRDVSTVESLCRAVPELAGDPRVANLAREFLQRAAEMAEVTV